MEQKTNLRHLHILQYLYEKTDDEHATDEEWQEFIARLEERKRKIQEGK